jgi:hypothetical protein
MLHLLNNTRRNGLTSEELFDAGINCYSDTMIEIEKRGAARRFSSSNSEHWELTEGARAVLNSCTVARRLDQATEVQVDRARVFCVMPFSAEVDPVWTSCIAIAVERAGLTATRGDTTLRTGNLIQNVWNEILVSGCVVADLSAPNPNVYYELGMAHALGRDVFVMVRRGVALPADLKGAHYLEYDPTNLSDAARDLESRLRAWRDAPNVRGTGVESLFP